MASYEDALQRLYQAPLANFLAERKRLAAELRTEGDEAGAAQIAKRAKPVTSVWVVNQLYWHARDAFDEMLATAARVREGDRGATKAHYDALAALRKRAAAMLKDAGLGASDATLRRVATTLAAIAATGSFAPDPPGALTADRDPPGFDAISTPVLPAVDERRSPAMGDEAAPPRARHAGQGRADAESASQRAARLRAADLAERRQREAERARRTAERARLREALRAATTEVRTRERALAEAERQLRAANKGVDDAREAREDLERQLAALDDAD